MSSEPKAESKPSHHAERGGRRKRVDKRTNNGNRSGAELGSTAADNKVAAPPRNKDGRRGRRRGGRHHAPYEGKGEQHRGGLSERQEETGEDTRAQDKAKRENKNNEELEDLDAKKMVEPLPHDSCVICTENLDNFRHRPTVGPCEHVGSCAMCVMRLRQLVKDKSCPLCKAQQEYVYVFNAPADVRPYHSLQIWGENAGPGMVFDDGSLMFMPKSFYKDVFQSIQAFHCDTATCRFKASSLGGLKAHLHEKHQLYLCEVCLEDKKVFLGEQIRYSKAQLQRHIEKGESKEWGFKGHPQCKFCKKCRFYDMGRLLEHLRRDHYTCDVCDRLQGRVQHRYYRDYRELEEHFRREHHLCEEPTCLAQRFVVFTNFLDLQAHVVNHHPESQGRRRRKIDLEATTAFRIRGGRGVEEAEEEVGEWTPEISGVTQELLLQQQQEGGEEEEEEKREEKKKEAFPALRPTTGASAAASSASTGAVGVGVPAPVRTSVWSAQQPSSSTTAGSGSAWGSSRSSSTSRPSLASIIAAAPPKPKPKPKPSLHPSHQQQQQLGPPIQDNDQQQEQPPVLARNRRFAEALGISAGIQGQARQLTQLRRDQDAGGGNVAAGSSSSISLKELDPYLLELERPVYPRELLSWATKNRAEVKHLEKKIQDFLHSPNEASLYLKPMPSAERKRIHLLAEFYHLKSISYDAEPRRFVALIKEVDLDHHRRSAVPLITLSEAALTEALHRGEQQQQTKGTASTSGSSNSRDNNNNNNKTLLPPSSSSATGTSSAACSLVVSNLGEASGKVVTDRLRKLVPGLPLRGYHFDGPDPEHQVLVVELDRPERVAEVLERAKRAAHVMHPFRLRLMSRGSSTSTSINGRAQEQEQEMAAAAAAAAVRGVSVEDEEEWSGISFERKSLREEEEEKGGNTGMAADGSSASSSRCWRNSVLAGRLVARRLPLPVQQQEQEVVKPALKGMHSSGTEAITRGGARGGYGGKGMMEEEEEEELRPGQGKISNRWVGLMVEDDDDDEDEGEEGAVTATAAAAAEEEIDEAYEAEDFSQVTWTCRLCTYDNSIYDAPDLCQMCQSHR